MNITKSEQQILETLWNESPLTVGQIIERIQISTDWHENTIKTLLTRLTEKGAVDRYKDGRRFFYKPLISKEEVLTKESEGFLKQFFGGRMAPLVAHFADKKKLSKRDIKEIEDILSKLKDTKS